MSKKIITISREYGSGGRQIGQLVSKKLGMDFYDKELIDLAAKEIGFSPELIADKEQRVTNSLLYNFAMGSLYGIAYPRTPKPEELPLTEQIFIAQKKIIQDAAITSAFSSATAPRETLINITPSFINEMRFSSIIPLV